MEGYEAFDLQRMFIGDFSFWTTLEIALRTGIMYLFALVAVRFIGKRGIGSLSPFEYVLVFALGSATGDPMFYPEVPLIHGMVAITVLVALQKGVLRVTQDNVPLESFLESRPTQLVSGGRIFEDKLKQEDVSREELMMKLRLAGVSNVGQVRFAYLEPSGDLSVFLYERGEQQVGQTTLISAE